MSDPRADTTLPGPYLHHPRHVHDIVLPPLVTSHTRRHATPRHATLSDEYIVCLSVSVLVQHDDLVRIDDMREREREKREKRERRERRENRRKKVFMLTVYSRLCNQQAPGIPFTTKICRSTEPNMAGDGWRGDGRLIYYSLLVLGGRRYEDEDEGGLGRLGGLGGRRRGSDEEETSLARSVLTSARRYQLSNGGKWENGQMGKWASTC